MTGARYALVVAYNVAWTGAIVLVAAWLISIKLPLESIDGDSDPRPELHQAAVSNSNCETTEVNVHVAEGQQFSHYSMKDDAGNEVVRVMYDRTGRVVVTWGEKLAVRAACVAKPGGAYDVNVVQGESLYRLLIRPDATSGFTVSGGPGGVCDGLGVNAGGELVHGPLILH